MTRWLSRLGLLGLAALTAWLLVASTTTGPKAEEGSPGLKVFNDTKCAMCHDVSSAGIAATTKSDKMKGGDLTGVTAKRDAEWFAKFIRQEMELDGARHKKLFKGTDDDIKAMYTWLETQK